MRIATRGRLAIGLLALLATAVAFQGGPPIPPTDDPTHPGQPSWCQNTDGGGFVHNCSCKPSSMADPSCQRPEGDQANPDEGGRTEASKCSVYCRPKACRCKRSCEHTR